jgi:hypothetical protein
MSTTEPTTEAGKVLLAHMPYNAPSWFTTPEEWV